MSSEEVRVVVPGTVHVIRGLAEGDKVVVQSRRKLSIEMAEAIQAQFKTYGIEAIILGPDLVIVADPGDGMTDWLVIVCAIAAVWLVWQMLNLVGDLLEKWYAARRGEAMQSDKERERSSSWQQQSS